MGRHFEITVRARAEVYVEDVANEEEAFAMARDALDVGGFEDLEMEAEELKTEAECIASNAHAAARSRP